MVSKFIELLVVSFVFNFDLEGVSKYEDPNMADFYFHT